MKGSTRHLQLHGNEGKYPESHPVLISWDHDLGWIIEAVENGEYEVKNLPVYSPKNQKIDWELAFEEAEKRQTRIRYFHKWGTDKFFAVNA